MSLQQLVSLEKEKKELERSNHDLIQFANVTSHDLRSPLMRVISFTNILLENSNVMADPEARSSVEKIKESSERMDLLIKSLLSYAKTDHLNSEINDIDLNGIICDVLADLDVMISEHRAKVNLEKLPDIPGHDVLLRQLFQNIISNCVKYKHPQRDPLITIKACASENPNHVVIAVADNGLGIDKEDAESIFEPFVRLNSTKHIEGSGLGLATVKRIIDLHKGKVWVESGEGHGSTFYLSFPKVSQELDQKRRENRVHLSEQPVELFCLNNSSQSYQMMLVDESSRGYGGKLIGKSDLHVGKILRFHEQTYEVCWILEFSQGAYRLGLKKNS